MGFVLEAGALPRELQRAMARDLRAAFPDMPPVRDFRALAASAAAACQEVRCGHGGASARFAESKARR